MEMKRQNLALLFATSLIGLLLWILGSTPKASAIPAFSRKYQTSCTTCHSNFPELNDFGEAFKKNGFKFPKDDETFVKEPPVLLGAKAQKEAFPKAVFPGEIPGSIPIALRYSGFAAYNSKRPFALGGFVPRTDLFMPNTFTIIAAGSFGPNISFWVDDDISTGGSGAAGGPAGREPGRRKRPAAVLCPALRDLAAGGGGPDRRTFLAGAERWRADRARGRWPRRKISTSPGSAPMR